MSRIKSILLSICLLLSVFLYAQSKDTLFAKGTTYNFHVPNFNATDYSLNFKSLSFPNNTPTLSLYNSTTNMYDNYSSNGNGHTYSNSTLFFENRSNFFIELFLENDSFMESNNSLMQNHFLIWGEEPTYRVRDSFNPYGATNIREALVGGILGLLFN